MSQKKRYKILFILGWYFPDNVGGTEHYVQSLALELNHMGHRVAIAAPSLDETERAYLHEGIKIYRYPITQGISPQEPAHFKQPEHFNKFAQWIEENKPDIVHFHSMTRTVGLPHARLVEELGIPLVLTIHTPEITCARKTMMRWGRLPCDGEMIVNRCSACYLQSKGLPRVLASLLCLLPASRSIKSVIKSNPLRTAFHMKPIMEQRLDRVRHFLQLADRIVVVSQWLYDVMVLNGVPPSKLYLSRHGLPQSKLTRGIKTSEESIGLKIGFVGRLLPIKGVHVLLKAIRSIPANKTVTVYVYANVKWPGEIDYLNKLKKISDGDTRIFFKDELNRENYSEVFGSMDILAIPSVWFEAGPLVALEALAAGVPVMGSDLGGIKEIIKHRINGLLVKPGDVKAWADAILFLLTNKNILREMRSNLKPVKSMKDVAREMDGLYQGLLTAGDFN